MNGIIKERDKTPSIMGTPIFFTKVGSRFPKIPIMRHYQGIHRNFGKIEFKKK